MATIAGIATSSGDFNILVAALTIIDSELPGANLIATLDDAGQDLTVFAPTDAAFTRLATDFGFTGDTSDETAVTAFLTTLGAETLRDIVLYHVSAGIKDAAAISALSEIDTLNGATIATDLPTLIDNEPDLIDPTLTATDIAADNGIVHVIDRVLLPLDLPGNDAPTIAGIVAASGGTPDADKADFDLLLTAVQAAGLAGALDDATADLTVFAPDDAAFIGLARALGFDGTDEGAALGYILDSLDLLGRGDSIGLLTAVLTYHVAPESLQSAQVLSATTIGTLQGGAITVNGTTLQDLDPDLPDPTIQAADIQAANGIVHVIDGVLIPADILPSNGRGAVQFVIDDATGGPVVGRANNDFLSGKGGDDKLVGAGGDDVLIGGDGDDLIVGGEGDDFALGGAGDDRLIGGGGADTLSGGAGRDVLVGAGGADMFVIAEGCEREVVVGFTDGEDVIDLTAFGFADFAAVAVVAKDTVFGLQINLKDGDVLAIRDFDLARLDASDVLLV